MRKSAAAALLIPALLLAGCWDRIEIEDRGFVVGTALDLKEDGIIKLTFQHVVPSGLQNKGNTAKIGGTKPYLNVDAEGHTVFKAARRMSSRVSRSPYLEHNRVILISEALARSGKMGEVLDLFIRDAETRRAANVLIAEGDASDLLNVQNTSEALPVQYIEETSENPDKSESITPPTNVGDVHGFLLRSESFAIPRIRRLDSKVSTSGAAVFNGHDNALRGYLDERETAGRNFLTGTLKAGAVEFLVQDRYVAFEVKRAKRMIRANVSDPEHPIFDLYIRVDGNIAESHQRESVIDKDMALKIRKGAEAEIHELADLALDKAQRQLKSDIFGLERHLYEDHYRTWKQVKDNWDHGDNYFATCLVRVHVDVTPHIVGSILKAQD